MLDEKPNYYAIIPAEVRYDKELKDKAKLLYGEITALANKTGECYATNNYFANLYEIEPETISRLIKNLRDKGYVSTKIIYKEGTSEIEKRAIKIATTPIDEKVNRYCLKSQEGIDEKVKENNTSINNKNKKEKEKSIFELIEENYMRSINELEYEEIGSWEDTKLTRFVIKESILKGIRNVKYISRILEDYRINNITTIEQAQIRERKFKQNKSEVDTRQQKKVSKWDEVRRRVQERKNNERR